MKYCKDCKHVGPTWSEMKSKTKDSGEKMDTSTVKCDHPSALKVIDYVAGYDEQMTCWAMRHSKVCGPNGTLFEAKEAK